MSTLTPARGTRGTGGARPGRAAGGVTPARVLRSEWHKLWSLRSTWITLAVTVVLTVATGTLIGSAYDPGGEEGLDPVVMVLLGTQFTQIILPVLGALTTAGEHSTGTVRATMTAVPRRLPVLWSKAAVLAAVALPVTLAANLITFALAQAFLDGTDKAVALGDSGVLRALLGNAVGLTLLGVIVLGLGAVIRSVPMAIGLFIGLIMILPGVLSLLPYDAIADADRYFPVAAIETLTTAQLMPPGTPSPGTALATLLLWTAATTALASVSLKHRDV